MDVEVFERDLRQVFEVDGDLARSVGFGLTEPISFACMPNPSKTMNRRYWSPGFGSPK